VDLAASLLRAGRVVVFPTETVYGLGADARNDEAVRRIFTAKERPPDNPLIVHVSDLAQLQAVAASVPDEARELFRHFAPGPLTIVLERSEAIGDVVTAGLSTVGVRFPSHPVARRVLDTAGVPIAAPSANRSGRPSPTDYASAVTEMRGRADAVLDGGSCAHGVESTVLRFGARGAEILREGAVTREMIARVLGTEALSPGDAGPEAGGAGAVDAASTTAGSSAEQPAASPGMRHAHYRPDARVLAVESSEVLSTVRTALTAGERVGIVGLESSLAPLLPPRGSDSGAGSGGAAAAAAGPRLASMEGERVWAVLLRDPEAYARELYRAFRQLDAAGVTAIVAEMPQPSGIGRAVRDRLYRAGGGS
jgi:L-threonylcarbamoyladenylate synthase